VTATPDGWRNQAIAQLCAFLSPEMGILSEMEMFHQVST
jgi:hypothetical protein